MAEVDPALEQQVLNVPEGSGYFTYIITTSRITSGEESNQRNGLGGGLGPWDFGFIPPSYPPTVSAP